MPIFATRIRQIEQGFSGTLPSRWGNRSWRDPKKSFAMSEKVRIFAPRKHGKFPTLASSTIGVCCVSHGERVAGRQSAWNWTRNRAHNWRWFFKMFSVCFPNALWYTGNQYVFYSHPGYQMAVNWPPFVIFNNHCTNVWMCCRIKFNLSRIPLTLK